MANKVAHSPGIFLSCYRTPCSLGCSYGPFAVDVAEDLWFTGWFIGKVIDQAYLLVVLEHTEFMAHLLFLLVRICGLQSVSLAKHIS